MATSMAPDMRNTIMNTNLVATTFLIVIAIYIFLCSVLERNLGNPMSDDLEPLVHLPNESFLTAVDVIRPQVNLGVTVMGLFLLWVVAVIFGRIIGYICLPSLLGALLAGIIIRNVVPLAEFWRIDSYWDFVFTQVAFILILIRCGINLEPDVLRKSLGIFTSLGILSTTVEALAIVLTSHFVFGISVPLSILFAYACIYGGLRSFVLAACSPAVTVPSLIRLQDQGRGTNKGIPTTILAANFIDNIYCITAYGIVASVVFTSDEDLTYLIVRIPVEVLVGMLFGILFGLMLRIFPREDLKHVHFLRSIIIVAFSCATLFATRAIGCDMVGPIAVFMMVVVASMRWKVDNHRMTRREERSFRLMWDALLQPFLFALIGLLFDFSTLTWDIFWNAMAIIFIGVAVRIIIIFIMSMFMHLSLKEQTFVAFSFLPKATVQAALVPMIIQYSGDHDKENMQFIFQTCVLSILVTAPIGQVLMDLFGKHLLDKEVNLTKRNFDPLRLPDISSFERTSNDQTAPPANGRFSKEPSFIQADKDNKLRLKVSPEAVQKNPAKNLFDNVKTHTITRTGAPSGNPRSKLITPPTTPKTKAGQTALADGVPPPLPNVLPPSFDDISSQAFEIFKEQRVKHEKRMQGGLYLDTIVEKQADRATHDVAKF